MDGILGVEIRRREGVGVFFRFLIFKVGYGRCRFCRGSFWIRWVLCLYYLDFILIGGGCSIFLVRWSV